MEFSDRITGVCYGPTPIDPWSRRWRHMLAAEARRRRVVGGLLPHPVPARLECPKCKVPHLDEGVWATKPHKTHLCLDCGHLWRPANFPTVGVAHTQGTNDDT